MMDMHVGRDDLRAVKEFEETVINVQCPQLKRDWKKLRPIEKKLLLESYVERLHHMLVMPPQQPR